MKRLVRVAVVALAVAGSGGSPEAEPPAEPPARGPGGSVVQGGSVVSLAQDGRKRPVLRRRTGKPLQPPRSLDLDGRNLVGCEISADGTRVLVITTKARQIEVDVATEAVGSSPATSATSRTADARLSGSLTATTPVLPVPAGRCCGDGRGETPVAQAADQAHRVVSRREPPYIPLPRKHETPLGR